ncbi:MAG: ornithine cyclodeaminase family protein [Aquabacterium sp.]
MRILDPAATRAALPLPALIDALRELFISGCEVPPRQVLNIGAGDDGLTSLVMPAWVEGRCYGVKTVNVAPGNAARGLPGLYASYVLFDAVTGAPLALLDGGELTARRTVAASALAASYLARADARHLLVVGGGRLAALLPQAHRLVRPIDRVTVWARRPEQAAALATLWRGQGLEASACDDLGRALADADIVSCATMARQPLVPGALLAAGSHLDLMGGFTPQMREADDAAMHGARIVIDTDEALVKSGDLVDPLARGVIRRDDIHATLAQLCRGERAGRQSASERTVFKSVGTALEDLAGAMLAAAA